MAGTNDHLHEIRGYYGNRYCQVLNCLQHAEQGEMFCAGHRPPEGDGPLQRIDAGAVRAVPVAPTPKPDFIIKDSGERREFASGMVRDTDDNKPDIELIFNGPMTDRWAEHLTRGAKKYPDVQPGVPNWMLAEGDAERIRFRKSAVRHFRQWLRGDVDEDHAAAVFFNINGYEYVKAKQRR